MQKNNYLLNLFGNIKAKILSWPFQVASVLIVLVAVCWITFSYFVSINPVGSTIIGKVIENGFTFKVISKDKADIFDLGLPKNQAASSEELSKLNKAVLALNFILNNYNKECTANNSVSHQLKAKCSYVYTDIIAKKYRGSILSDKRLPEKVDQNNLIYKMKYFLLTKRLERHFSETEFLGFLLNYSYYGNGVFGVQKAISKFFGKDANINNLNLPQIAFLVKSLFFNNDYIYNNNKEYKLIVTENKIMEAMNKLGYVSNDELQQAKNTKLAVNNGLLYDKQNQYNIYFKDLIGKGLEYFNKTNSINIYTTFNNSLQVNFATILSDNAKKYNIAKASVIAVKDGEITSGMSFTNANNVISFNNNYPTVKVSTLLRPLLYLEKLQEEQKISTALLNKDIQNVIVEKYLDPRSLTSETFSSLAKDDRVDASLTTILVMNQAAKQLVDLENKVFSSIDSNNIEKLKNEFRLGGKFLFSTNYKMYTDTLDLQSLVNTYATLNQNGNYFKEIFVSNINDKKPEVNSSKRVNYSVEDISKILKIINVERMGNNYFQIVYDRNVAVIMYRGYTIGLYLGNSNDPVINFYVNRYPVLKLIAKELVNAISQNELIKMEDVKK